jgi:hypothetical protein
MGAQLASLSTVLGATQDSGLSFITSTSFSAVASVSIDNCFSARFDNYRVIFQPTASVGTDSQITIRLRVGGVNASTNYDTQRIVGFTASAVSSNNLTGTDDWSSTLINSTHADRCLVQMDLFAPAIARTTVMLQHNQSWSSGSVHYVEVHAGHHTTATAYDGITFLTGGTSFTGTIYVYGYRLA